MPASESDDGITRTARVMQDAAISGSSPLRRRRSHLSPSSRKDQRDCSPGKAIVQHPYFDTTTPAATATAAAAAEQSARVDADDRYTRESNSGIIFGGDSTRNRSTAVEANYSSAAAGAGAVRADEDEAEPLKVADLCDNSLAAVGDGSSGSGAGDAMPPHAAALASGAAQATTVLMGRRGGGWGSEFGTGASSSGVALLARGYGGGGGSKRSANGVSRGLLYNGTGGDGSGGGGNGGGGSGQDNQRRGTRVSSSSMALSPRFTKCPPPLPLQRSALTATRPAPLLLPPPPPPPVWSGIRDLDGCLVWYADDSAAEADIESMASVASIDSREVRGS